MYQIKLYRGPGNGKRYTVHDISKEILFASSPNLASGYYNSNNYTSVAIETRKSVYRLKMVRNPLDHTELIPCIYPDGSVCFEYVGS